jgi:3-dehydroquinate synthase
MTVVLGDRSYDIFIGREIYSLFQEWICRFYPGGTVHVVTDRNVASIYGDDIRRWLAGIPHDVLALPPGEEHKNFDTVKEIYGFLARGDAGRDSLVVAFGGGVVGDLAGFAAATFLRGISCIQVPTTLLSQVDSSVGGKTGFNLPEGKNLVGAFHQPRAVFIDDAFLRTLDDRNLRAGMAEVVKCALAGDPGLWDRLLSAGGKWRAFDGEEWRWVVRRAVAFKASVVERDEKETSLRRILNLGHTIGHAMEKSCGYGRLLHGEAVAMGLAWEAILGMKLGVTGGGVVDDLVSLLIDMGFPLDDPGVALTSIAAAIGMDKKRLVSDVDLPLVAAPGRCELRRVPLAEIRRELPGIRAEIRERSIARELNIPEGDAIREESPVSNLVRVGDDVYEIRSVEEKIAPEDSEPETVEEQATAVEPEPSPAPPEIPVEPAVRTVTLADLYWSQGEHSTAIRIVGEILRDDPANLRAQAWLAVRAGDDLVEADLLGFLETMAKEYGYDLS